MSNKSDDDADGLDLKAAKPQLKRQKREIKEKDALIADQDALIAANDALIAARNALIADQNAQLDYSRWLTLEGITETMQPSADSSKYSEVCKSYKTLFNSFRPRDPNSRVAGSA